MFPVGAGPMARCFLCSAGRADGHCLRDDVRQEAQSPRFGYVDRTLPCPPD